MVLHCVCSLVRRSDCYSGVEYRSYVCVELLVCASLCAVMVL